MDDSDDEEPPCLIPVENPAETIESELPPCPVTILSGFLGSGKTTLIQYILKSPDHGKRIAVIENEFGEGLQVESLIARDGVDNNSLTDLIELPNGCICCTVKDSLVSTLENLLDKRKDLDYILIECSGMANPGPIASLFWLDEALESRLRLDGIVTIVDAANIERQLSETEEAADQIAYGDRILLNKIDLLGDEDHDKQRLMNIIQLINQTADVIPTSFSTVPDLSLVLDARCFDPTHFRDVEQTLTKTVETLLSESTRDHHHGHDHDEGGCSVCLQHKHTQAISTHAINYERSVDVVKLNKWLASILWPNQDEKDSVLRQRLENPTEDGMHRPSEQHGEEQRIYRVKGVLSVHGDGEESKKDQSFDEFGLDGRRFIVQAVHDLWDIYPASSNSNWRPDEKRCSKLVIIGRNLDRSELDRGFHACCTDYS